MEMVFCGVCSVVSWAGVDYNAFSLKRMVRLTELVVEGSVARVEAKVFHIKVRQHWGRANKKMSIIRVLRFQNWPCVARRPYKVGQKGFFFLVRQKKQWRVMGAGNEG